jgi:hypothetical protein
MKIGDKIYVKNLSTNEIEETTINYVGKKYFKIEGRGYLFSKNSWHNKPQKKEFISKYKCYRSLQEIETEKEKKYLMQFISDNINRVSLNLTIEQLREIKKIIN